MSVTAQKTVQILLVDDHALFREGVARLLGADPGFEVAGDCGSIEEGLDVLRQKSIDIVLLDFYLGDRNGKEFVRLARLHGFAGKVLLVTVGIDEANATDLIRAGISGIFLKRDSPSLLAQAIRYVIGGGCGSSKKSFRVQWLRNHKPVHNRKTSGLPRENNRFFPTFLKASQIGRSRNE